MRHAFWFWWHLTVQIFRLCTSRLWMIFCGCAVNVASVRLSCLKVFVFFSPCWSMFYCCSFIPRDLQREMEDNASMLLERATERLHPGAGREGVGGGQIGTGWEADGGGFVPSAQQKGDWRWPRAPPLPLTAFREMPYHLTSTIPF